METKCFTPEQINKVFKIECFQKDPLVFEKTHYGLNLVFKDPQSRETKMMEDALVEQQWSRGLQARRDAGDYIRPYIIWGAPGTGKTELCRWLELKIPKNNTDYVTKRITKRDLAIGGILGVAQALSNQPIDLSKKLTMRHAGRGVEHMITWALGTMMEEGRITLQTGDKENVLQLFENTIRKNIENRVKLIDETDDVSKIETSLEFITQRDIETTFSYYGIKIDVARVNREIYHSLTMFLANVKDVKKLIFDYIKNKNSEGKIPVLLFDDVTHLGDLVDEFVSVVTDITGGEEGYVCDFVIGTTTDFYNNKFKEPLASTARARTFEIKLSPEESNQMQNANWLLGDDGLKYFLNFVLRYLDTARVCSNCNICNGLSFIEKKYNYYPFTKTFLINLYNRLFREKDESSSKGIVVSLTPRFIIQLLRDILINFEKTSRAPSEFVDDSLLFSTLDFFNVGAAQINSNKTFYRAIWWYGEHSDENQFKLSKNLQKDILLETDIPSAYVGKEVFNLNVSQLKGTKPIGDVNPESPDDVSIKANIRSWCKGEGSQVAIKTIADGFNIIISGLEKTLSGSNNFRNVMNNASSRVEGDVLEYSSPGAKKAYFWIGELRNDTLQIYLLSKYKIESQNISQLKEFMILSLDEDDFFRLYKIGNSGTDDSDRMKYQKEFLNVKRDDVLTLLFEQKQKIRCRLNEKLGCSIESYVLANYVLLSRLLKTGANKIDIKSVEDIKHLQTFEIDITVDDWPENRKLSVSQLSSYFTVIDDLFHSLFSLRGRGTVMDYYLLSETWESIKDNPYNNIRNAEKPDDNFVLYKSQKKFSPIVDSLKSVLVRIERFSSIFDKDFLEKNTANWKQLLNQIQDKKQLVNILHKLQSKLKNNHGYELQTIIEKLIVMKEPQKILLEIKALEDQAKIAKDPIQKIGLEIALTKAGKDNSISTSNRLNNFINRLEEQTSDSLENNLESLKKSFQDFLSLEATFNE